MEKMLKFLFATHLWQLVESDCKVCRDVPHRDGYLVSGSPPVVVAFELSTFDGDASDLFVYVDVVHSYLGDLQMSVSHSGLHKYVFKNECGTARDLRAYFHDSGTEDVCYDTYDHTYDEVYDARSTDSLEDFNTVAKTGFWNVTVADVYSSDDGFLKQVCIGWNGDCEIFEAGKFKGKDCNHISRNDRIFALDKCQLSSEQPLAFKYHCMSDGTRVRFEEYMSVANCENDRNRFSTTVLNSADASTGISSLKCDGHLADGCDVLSTGYDLDFAARRFLDDTCVADTTPKTADQLKSLRVSSVRNTVCGVCVAVSDQMADSLNFSSYAYGCDAYANGRMDMRTWLTGNCTAASKDHYRLDAGCYVGRVPNPPHALQRIDDGANGTRAQEFADYYTFNCSNAADVFKPTIAPTTAVPTTPRPTVVICSHVQTAQFALDPKWAIPMQTCFWLPPKNAFVRFLCPYLNTTWNYNFSRPLPTAPPNTHEIWVYGENDVYCNDLDHKETVDNALSVVCTNYICPQDDVIIVTATADECPISDLNDLRVASDDYKEQPLLVDFCLRTKSTEEEYLRANYDSDKRSIEAVRYKSQIDCENEENGEIDSDIGTIEGKCDLNDNSFVNVFGGEHRPMSHNEDLVLWYETCQDTFEHDILDNSEPIIRVDFTVPQFEGYNSDKLQLFVYLDVTHSYLGDLEILLEHRGIFRYLMRQQCRWLSDLRAYFFDSAPAPLENEGCEEHFYGNRWYNDALYAFNSTFNKHSYDVVYNVTAAESLAAFDLEPKEGSWQVTVEDQAEGDEGKVHKVCIGWFGPMATLPPTTLEPETTDKSSGGGNKSGNEVSAVVIGVIVCVVLALCALTGTGFWWYRKKQGSRSQGGGPQVTASQRRLRYVQFTDGL